MNHDNTIQLVEDNPDDQELTRLAFEQSGNTNHLDIARDGAEALDYPFAAGARAGRDGGHPNLILLELKLPKTGGLDVPRQLRAEPCTRLLPVDILTSSAEEQDVICGYDPGCNSSIRKPVDFTQFSLAIRVLGLNWMALNGPPMMEGAA